jgi:hypothetical protein
VAITAVAGAASGFSGLCPRAWRIPEITAYPQAMPKLRDKKIVNRTVVEANTVLIGFGTLLRCPIPAAGFVSQSAK